MIAHFFHSQSAEADKSYAGVIGAFALRPVISDWTSVQPAIPVRYAALPEMDQLRTHVLDMLCKHDHLDPAQTPLHEATIKRQGRICGLFFQVQGPRLLKTYAVWAGEESRILFYDSTGQRFAETKLSDGPDPIRLAA